MPQSRNKKKKRKTALQTPAIPTSTINHTSFNPDWLSKLARWASLFVLIPLLVGIGGNWFHSFLTNGVLLQSVGLASDKALLFKLKNNLPFDVIVADLVYQPDKVSVRINKDVYADEVHFEIDEVTGKVKGLRFNEDKGIDATQITNRVKGLWLKSGDEINIRFPTDFPTDSSEEKLSFQISFGITPRHLILSAVYWCMDFLTFTSKNEKGFFLLERGVIQSISQKQFQTDIESM